MCLEFRDSCVGTEDAGSRCNQDLLKLRDFLLFKIS